MNFEDHFFIFRDLLSDSPGFGVPRVIQDLTTKRVLTTELISGVPLDQCVSLDQDVKNDVMITRFCFYFVLFYDSVHHNSLSLSPPLSLSLPLSLFHYLFHVFISLFPFLTSPPLIFPLSLPPSHQIAVRVLELCLRELFEFKVMQTDPNWSNFYYNQSEDKVRAHTHTHCSRALTCCMYVHTLDL